MSGTWILLGGALIAVAMAAVLVSGRTKLQRLVNASLVLLAGLSGLGVYAMTGRPDAPDMPFSAREAELARRDPNTMTGAELLVLLQTQAREHPEDPRPHFFIGKLLASEDREGEAVRAYQSALRRDENYVPALMALADTFVRLDGGGVSLQSAQIYARAIQLDPTQARAGFLAGFHFWDAGETDKAREFWRSARAQLAGNEAGLAQFDAMMAAVTGESPAE